ncbi:MAG: hypothetical protein IIY11_07025 [Clostridia bacterium]|nr:hypothetical protein [Clostridia bacterium]
MGRILFGSFGEIPQFESPAKLPGDTNILWKMACHYLAPADRDAHAAYAILERLVELDTEGQFMEAREALGRLLLDGDGIEPDRKKGAAYMLMWYHSRILNERRLYAIGQLISESLRDGTEDFTKFIKWSYERICLDNENEGSDPVGLCFFWHLLRLAVHQLERETRLLDDPKAFLKWMVDEKRSPDALYHLCNLDPSEDLSRAARSSSIFAIDQLIGPDFRPGMTLNEKEERLLLRRRREDYFARKKKTYKDFNRAQYLSATYSIFRKAVALNREADAVMEQRHAQNVPSASREISRSNWREHDSAPTDLMACRFERLKAIYEEYRHPMTLMTMGTYVVYPKYGGVPEEECLKYLKAAADVGITLAIVYLGLHYYRKGRMEEALPLLRKAALRGFSGELQLSCALCLLALDRSPSAMQEAGLWMRLARDNGSKTAAEYLDKRRSS